MKLLSEACEYALRAVVWLAQNREGPWKVREIAEAIHAPPGYLIKVLQLLAKRGVLSAQRGNQGGFNLLRDPEQLSILEIVDAVDPIERLESCPLKLQSHGVNLCPLHRQIDDAMAAIEKAFRDSTVGDLLKVRKGSPPLCEVLSE